MSDNELKMLSDHMGHEVNIHANVYRGNRDLIERSRMAKVLVAFEDGTITRLAKQTPLDVLDLDKIHINGKCSANLCNVCTIYLSEIFSFSIDDV